jgi:hypothetical protein
LQNTNYNYLVTFPPKSQLNRLKLLDLKHGK